MNTFRQQLRHLARRAARAFARSAPYLFAIDPSRSPPPAVWPSAWRLEPSSDRTGERTPVTACCGCCG